jgi:uncharacterized protein (DUF924 family)
MAWQDEVLGFWFGLDREQWWKADPALDSEIKERFLACGRRSGRMFPRPFLGSARDAVAAVILFDQFPRNMFRGHADQFSTDKLALAVAKGAGRAGLDEAMSPAERGFLYMPFQHSEDLATRTARSPCSPRSATIISSAMRGSIMTSSPASAAFPTATRSSAGRRARPRSRRAT